MDRRDLLRAGAVGAGLAAAALAGGAIGEDVEHRRDLATQERRERGVPGHGRVEVVWSATPTEPVAALTFDDGPHPELTPRVLDLLAAADVRATFFLIGREAERRPELVHRIVAAGHEIGNHTWRHQRLAELPTATVLDEIAHGAAAVEQVAGRRARWFRPPRGMVDGAVLRGAELQRQRVALWSADTHLGSLEEPARDIARHLLDRLRPGTIYLFHDGTSGRRDAHLLQRRHQELPAYPGFVAGATRRGFRFATLSDLVPAAPG